MCIVVGTRYVGLFICIMLCADWEQGYVLSNGITNGSDNPSKRCREAQAVTAFLWFGFAAFIGSLVFSALSMKGSTTPRPSIIRRGGPSMSQV